jgi:eukaryotic translation initiation factor 2C
MTVVGSSFFSGQQREPLGPGAEVWLGYHQSIRPGKKSMLVNIDTAASVFVKAQPLKDRVQEVLNVEDLRHVTCDHRSRLRKEIVGIKVQITHCPQQKRKYRVRDISKQSAADFQ